MNPQSRGRGGGSSHKTNTAANCQSRSETEDRPSVSVIRGGLTTFLRLKVPIEKPFDVLGAVLGRGNAAMPVPDSLEEKEDFLVGNK